MPRDVKKPDERRRELLSCAMRLFAEKGYDNVSVRAVARECGVAAGLAYHYFDSKERMFAEAIEEYARRCAERINTILDERDATLEEKIDRALRVGINRDGFPFTSFFHDARGGTLHDRLSLAMCEQVLPHMQAALEDDARQEGHDPVGAATTASMMVYGCIGLASMNEAFDQNECETVERRLLALVDSYRQERIP